MLCLVRLRCCAVSVLPVVYKGCFLPHNSRYIFGFHTSICGAFCCKTQEITLISCRKTFLWNAPWKRVEIYFMGKNTENISTDLPALSSRKIFLRNIPWESRKYYFICEKTRKLIMQRSLKVVYYRLSRQHFVFL